MLTLSKPRKRSRRKPCHTLATANSGSTQTWRLRTAFVYAFSSRPQHQRTAGWVFNSIYRSPGRRMGCIAVFGAFLTGAERRADPSAPSGRYRPWPPESAHRSVPGRSRRHRSRAPGTLLRDRGHVADAVFVVHDVALNFEVGAITNLDGESVPQWGDHRLVHHRDALADRAPRSPLIADRATRSWILQTSLPCMSRKTRVSRTRRALPSTLKARWPWSYSMKWSSPVGTNYFEPSDTGCRLSTVRPPVRRAPAEVASPQPLRPRLNMGISCSLCARTDSMFACAVEGPIVPLRPSLTANQCRDLNRVRDHRGVTACGEWSIRRDGS